MPHVRPVNAKKAVMKFAVWFVGAIETLEAIESGASPILAVKQAVKKAKQRKKKEKLGKKLRKKEKEVIDVT